MNQTNSALKETAADWVVRISDPEATEADFDAWQAWLAQSPTHREIYQALEQAWTRASQVSSAPWPMEAELRADRRRPYKLALAAGLAAVVVGGASWMLHRAAHVLQTTTAEQRSVRLSDGSRVQLGGESRLRVDLNTDVRTLRLERGEAYFDVAQDASRPFIVHVGEGEIRALGTAFNVERSADRTVVTVTQGRVRVSKGKSTLDLGAGEQGRVGPEGLYKQQAAVDPHAVIAWRDGRLEYLHEELRYVVDDVNRYVDRKIAVNDPQLARLEFTGTVFLDHLDEWLKTLQGSFPVVLVERDGRRELVHEKK